METIYLNGKKYNCKTHASELTCGDLEKIYSDWDIHNHPTERDYVKLVCILSGAEYFAEYNLDKDAQQSIWLVVKDIIQELWQFSTEVPERITIDGKSIEVGKEIRHHAVGPNIVLRQAIDRTKYLQQSLSLACAVYLQPAYDAYFNTNEADNKFNLKSALKLQTIIKQMPAREVYGIGFFILRRAKKSGVNSGHVLLRILNSLNMNLRKTFLGWQNPDSLCATRIYLG